MSDQKSGSSPWWIRLAVGRRPQDRTLRRAGLLLLSSLVTFKFLIFPIRVVGISMIPACRNGTVNLVNRIRLSIPAETGAMSSPLGWLVKSPAPEADHRFAG